MKLKCDLCKQWEDKNISTHKDVWSIFQEVLESHRKISPECKGDRYTIRIMRS